VKKIWVIASKDVSEAFHSRSIYLVILVAAIFAFSFGSSYNRGLAANAGPAVVSAYSRDFLSMVAYIVPLMYSIIICNVFSNYTVVLDKARRNLESLMATPVSIGQVWIGKSLSVVLPSLILGLGFSLIVFLGFEFVLVLPKAHAFVLPDALAIVTALVIVPVLIFGIVTVVTNIQLVIANPRIANLVFTGIFILLIVGFDLIGRLGGTTAYFPLIYLGVLVVCGAISYVLSGTLTKEKVLLSSKD
jgi:ABC-type Na+ efflux pump permease subunit